MIRPAIHSDIDSIAILAEKAWRESAFGDFEHDAESVRRTAIECIKRPDCYLRVLEIDGFIRGMIVGAIGPAPGLRGEVATESFFYVEPEFRGRGMWLLRGFIRWAFWFKSVRCIWLQISMMGDEAERTEKLYQRLGAQRAGASFVVRRNA